MTPTINPAFARFVVSVKPALPEYLSKNQYKLRNLEAGKTTEGKVRQRSSPIYRKLKPRRRIESSSGANHQP